MSSENVVEDPDPEVEGRPKRRRFTAEYKERHLAVVFQITSEVDSGHSAAADLSVQSVTAGESKIESLEVVGPHTNRSAVVLVELRRLQSPSSRCADMHEEAV